MWGNIFKFHYLSSLFAISCAFLFLAALLKIKLIFGQACLQTIFRLNPYSELVAVPCTEQIFPGFWAYFFSISYFSTGCSVVFLSFSWCSDAALFTQAEALFLPLLCDRSVPVTTQWSRSRNWFGLGKWFLFLLVSIFFSLPSELSHLINILLASSVPGECSQSYFC